MAMVLFAKSPRAGFVKTRLTERISPQEAAEFHRLCLFAAWHKLSSVEASDHFLYCDIHDAELERMAATDRFRLQRGADLGEKMRRCLEDLLAEGYRKVLIIGSDSPTLPVEHVTAAIEGLGIADVVLGPCEDGGFYLVGARKADTRMFDAVTWSDGETRAQTVRAVKAIGLSVAEVAEWYDVDEPSDLDRLEADPILPASLQRWFAARLPRLQ